MAHCAGYVASKMRDRDLGAPSSSFDRGDSMAPKEALSTHLLSAGGLTLPTENWLEQYRAMDLAFRAFHCQAPDRLSREPRVITRLTDVLCRQHPGLNRRVITRFVQLRTFKRMSDINRDRHNAANAKQQEAQKVKKFVGASV